MQTVEEASASVRIELALDDMEKGVLRRKAAAMAAGMGGSDDDFEHPDDTRSINEACIQLILALKAKERRAAHEKVKAHVAEDNACRSREQSELLGISLEWVLRDLHNSAWTRLQEKQNMPEESSWRNEESNVKLYRDAEESVKTKMKDLAEDNINDLNFISLSTFVAKGPTGVGKSKTCPRDKELDCSIVDGVFEIGGSGPATIFMSWVWIYTVAQVLSGLEHWHTKNYDQKRRHHFIWWCFMCNNQYRLDSCIESSEVLSQIFGQRLSTIGRMLIMLDTIENPLYVTRCWCLFEVWKVVEMHMAIDVTITLSRDGLEQLRKSMRSHRFSLEDCLSIGSRKAEATQPEDKQFIMEQIGSRHHEVGDVVRKKLLSLVSESIRNWVPEAERTRDRFRNIIERLKKGANDERAEMKDLVVVIGNTGSGKSTTINFLHGCEMVRFGIGAKRQVKVLETSTQKEISTIGHTNLSQIDFPQVFELSMDDNTSMYLCDCPGFVDQRGSDVSIANIHNINKTIRAARSVRFLLTVSFSSIIGDRGKAVDELLYSLLEMFGGSIDKLEANKSAILLCVTKAPISEDGEVFNRDMILSSFKTTDEVTAHFRNSQLGEIFSAMCINSIVYHPVVRDPPVGWLRRKDFLEVLKRMEKVQDHGRTCVIAPTAFEVSSMRNLFQNIVDEIDESIKKSCLQESDSLFRVLRTWKQAFFTGGAVAHSIMQLNFQIENETADIEKRLKELIRKQVEEFLASNMASDYRDVAHGLLRCAEFYKLTGDEVETLQEACEIWEYANHSHAYY